MGLSLRPPARWTGEFSGCHGNTNSLPLQLIRLEENDTKTKLETLFKKNLYPTAIKLVV